MTIHEAIRTIECAKAEVEWNYPLDYAVALDMAIKALEEQDKNRWVPVSDRNRITKEMCKRCDRKYDCNEDCDFIKIVKECNKE